MIKLQKKILILIVITSLLLLNGIISFGQPDTSNIYQYNLIELSKLKVVSDLKTEQNLTEVLATIKIITQEDILENGYFTLDEALADLPGFQFRNILGLNSYIFQRGLPRQNNAILVLIDGIQINELNSGGFYGGGQYNLANVKQIEIIYGSASAIYGTNALSGIINIITKDIEDKTNFSANTLVGTFNTSYTDVNYNFYNKEKDIGFRMSGMFKTTEKADLTGKAGDYNWTDDMEIFETDYSFDAKLNYKEITGGVNYQNRQSSTSTHYPSNGTSYKDNGTLWNLQFINAYIKHAHDFSDKLSISSSIYNRNTTVLGNSVKIITDTSQIAYYRPNYLLGAESIINYNLKQKLFLTGGISYEYESLANGYSKTTSDSYHETPPTPSTPDMQNNQLMSGFLQTRYKFSFPIIFVAGLRYDNSTIYDQVITPRTGLIFNYKQMSIKALYNEAFRAPKPWDYTDGIGNPDLLPEKMKSFELSGIFTLKQNFRIETSVYKNIMDNAIIKNYLNENNYMWDNIGNITTDGFELSLNYSYNKLKLHGNYTYNFSYDNNKQIVDEIAKHSANFSASYLFLKYFTINVKANYLGKRKNPTIISATNSNYINPAWVFHSSLSLLRYKNANVQIMIRNILNTEYYHTSNLTPERYRQPQRSVSLKIAYSIKK